MPIKDISNPDRRTNLSVLIKNILAEDTKAPSSMARDMGMVHSSTAKAESMLAIGLRIKCMGKEYYTILIKRLLTKGIGKTTSFQAQECSTMKKSLR